MRLKIYNNLKKERKGEGEGEGHSCIQLKIKKMFFFRIFLVNF